MKIPMGFWPSLAAATGPGGAPNLMDLKLEDGFLLAANGRAGLAIDVSETLQPGDCNGILPIEAVRLAEEHRSPDWSAELVAGPEDVVVTYRHGQTLIAKRERETLYPDLMSVLRKHCSKPGTSFGVSVKQLSRLAKALGTDAVQIRLVEDGALRMLVVAPSIDRGVKVLAVLAPLRDIDELSPVEEEPREEDESLRTFTEELLGTPGVPMTTGDILETVARVVNGGALDRDGVKCTAEVGHKTDPAKPGSSSTDEG